MPLSAEEIAAAEKMHDFVRRYENSRRNSFRSIRLGILVGLLGQLLAALNHHILHLNSYETVLVCGPIVVIALLQFFHTKARYRRERILLRVLERDHAEQLPWVEEEAAAARYKVDLTAYYAAAKRPSLHERWRRILRKASQRLPAR